jgi:hypothetical protein
MTTSSLNLNQPQVNYREPRRFESVKRFNAWLTKINLFQILRMDGRKNFVSVKQSASGS